MRTESEMLDLILSTARADERIRAVVQNGSRVNPSAPRDPFQDYDVVYFVTDVEPFRHNLEWIRRFGELMILQLPDEMNPPARPDHRYAYLMQFAEGDRIDLTIVPVADLPVWERDSLTVALLDKDGILPAYPPPDESGYLPEPPDAKQYGDVCNEFWWCSPYVAKGLWRGQITYAQAMLGVVREQLMQMLVWRIGVKTNFAVNPGKDGKTFQRWLDPEEWELVMRSYADAKPDHIWGALEAMGVLFRSAAGLTAEHFGFAYPQADDDRVSAHLAYVRKLPKDAETLYAKSIG